MQYIFHKVIKINTKRGIEQLQINYSIQPNKIIQGENNHTSFQNLVYEACVCPSSCCFCICCNSVCFLVVQLVHYHAESSCKLSGNSMCIYGCLITHYCTLRSISPHSYLVHCKKGIQFICCQLCIRILFNTAQQKCGNKALSTSQNYFA